MNNETPLDMIQRVLVKTTMTLRSAAEGIGKMQAENALLKRIVDRLPLCPDHRDKVRDRCIECDCEELRKRLAKIERERR